MSDPIWLTQVLRDAGLTVNEYPGAYDRGHGDFGTIWGVVCHHTGSFGETPKGIAEHPSLGLASQLYLSRDGVYTLCGVGIAWHAGVGSWPGIATNNANAVTIGIEAANDGGGTPGKPHRTGWSDAQYNSYVRGVAAILNKLGQPASRAIGHKEWAGTEQGKWDPGAIDMNIFRSDVARVQNELRNPVVAKDVTPEAVLMTNQEKFDRIFTEVTQLLESRSKYRNKTKPYKDTLAGYVLQLDAQGNEAQVERDALMGDKDALALVKREADAGDAASKLVYNKAVSA